MSGGSISFLCIHSCGRLTYSILLDAIVQGGEGESQERRRLGGRHREGAQGGIPFRSVSFSHGQSNVALLQGVFSMEGGLGTSASNASKSTGASRTQRGGSESAIESMGGMLTTPSMNDTTWPPHVTNMRSEPLGDVDGLRDRCGRVDV
jgi:hypothetical protein